MNLDYSVASVYGIYGSLGGGKSLTAVDIMLQFMNLGHEVYSNIQLINLSKQKRKLFHYYDPESTPVMSLPYGDPRGSKGKKRVCIVLDECAEFLDQFTSTSTFTKDFCSWLRHTSKNGQFVFLIVQQPEFLVKSVRLIVNKWICCTDLAQFVLPVLRLRIPFTKGFVWRRIFDRHFNLISRGFDIASKRVFGQFYDTSQLIASKLTKNRSYQHETLSKYALWLPMLWFFYVILLIVCLFIY